MLEILLVVSAIAAVSFAALWWQAVAQGRVRAQLWRDALAALAARDFAAVEALAAQLQASAETALAASLRVAVVAEHAERDQRRRTQLELADVLSSLQDAVLVVDGEARLRFVNAAALQFFGVRIEAALGAQVLEVLPSFGLESALRAALQEGKDSAREVGLYVQPGMMTVSPPGGMVGADGAGDAGRREIFLRVTPLRHADGMVSGAVAIVQDLTEMRRLERVRREFVANASHELRTPVANILAAAETMLEASSDPALVNRFMPHLVGEAGRLSRLVTDLLDLARVEAQDEVPHDPVDLAALARSVVGQLQAKADQNHVVVRCEGEAAWVSGDAAALEQVVFNLLDNALSYTPAGGDVTLRVEREQVADLAANGAAPPVTLAVRDTGLGIPGPDLPHVFERFYRVDKARSRSQGGTGLGLAIVKHIVENHGGHVKVESETGQGTTFTVALPGA
jgi:two-component system, OmpR family, phosphate regulon sensor histidine kinase PhoR